MKWAKNEFWIITDEREKSNKQLSNEALWSELVFGLSFLGLHYANSIQASNVFCISNVFTAAFFQRLLKNMMMMMIYVFIKWVKIDRKLKRQIISNLGLKS